MRRLKYEMYCSILEAFINHGPMRLSKATSKTNLNYSILKKLTSDLLVAGLLERRTLKGITLYAASPKARDAILKIQGTNTFENFKS